MPVCFWQPELLKHVEAWVAIGDRVSGEFGDPAVGIVEKSQRAETRWFTHVEPVTRPCRNLDPVIGFTEHLHHFMADVQTEKTAAFHEEPHFIFRMNVFTQKLAA